MNEECRDYKELMGWAEKRGLRVTFYYDARNPVNYNGEACTWMCIVGEIGSVYVSGIGTTIDRAITDCWCEWKQRDLK